MVEDDFAADNFSLQEAVDETEQIVPPIRINISLRSHPVEPRMVTPLRINRCRLPGEEAPHDVSIVHGDDTVEIIPGMCT